MLTTEDLINSGYLPEEIIPPINTETLSKILPNILANLENFLAGRKTSKCCQFSIPRQKQFRRLLEIPNPLHQIRLSKTLENSWSSVDNYLSKSKISLSRPEPQANSKRAIAPFIPYEEFGEVKSQRILRSTASKYLLQADISRFYHSIYTHSIAWALHTKPSAKIDRGPTLLGNAIDKDVRNTRDGQTSGIPIGPDTSRIISEIIGTGIDIALEERLEYLSGVRHIDDFYLYFKSLADLEKGYSILQSVLQEFELELNPAKVDKIELPAESIESRWILEIRSFRFREDRANEQRDDLISYFDLAFRNAVLFPNEPVLDYAITKISSREIKRQNWIIFEALMLKTLIVEPKILPTILKVFLRYKTKGYELYNESQKLDHKLSTK